ncbi:MAG TPA: glycosyltransferase family 4 protein [Vicinamibacterales bacterium]|nr:glycosyltransferase family 4 protein [Vicinamibacterales bacterium]
MSGARLAILELRSVRGTGGGPEKTILLGTEQTDRTRFAVTVCYLRDLRDPIFGIDERARRMNIDYVEVQERHSFDPRIWTPLSTLVRERRIDIVHSHDYKTDLLGWLLARRLGVIPLSTAHGWTGQSARERYVYYPAGKRLLARFPRVIAVSSDIRRELVRHGQREHRVTVILNGIDPDAFKRDVFRRGGIRQALGLAPDDVVIGAVGRLERQKRFDVLLEAFMPLARARPNLRLVIVGDGSLKSELAAKAGSLGLGKSCLLLGHRLDVADLHNAFDLFVQASEYEGTPNAALEAMAMSTPIVATDVGGTAELAAHEVHGLLVAPHDVPGLTAAMNRALGDPTGARTRAAAARFRVEHELSFHARTRHLERVYEDLARERDEVKAMRGIPHHA